MTDTSSTSGASPEQRRAQAERESAKCKTCDGSGQVFDAAISRQYLTWVPCPACANRSVAQADRESDAAQIGELCAKLLRGLNGHGGDTCEYACDAQDVAQAYLALAARAVEPEGDAVEQEAKICIGDTVSDAANAAWVDYTPPDLGRNYISSGLRDAVLLRHAFLSGWNACLSAAPRSGRREGMLRAAEIAREEWGKACNGQSTSMFTVYDRLCAEADALLAEQPTDDGWRDIASAPIDTRILLYIPAYDAGDPVRLGEGAPSRWRTTSGDCPPEAQPTMWRPLPPPPSART